MHEIVKLRSAPQVNDFPAQLRHMADQIGRGDVKATASLFIVPRGADWPNIFGWGECMSDQENIATCEMAKAWFINNLVARNA